MNIVADTAAFINSSGFNYEQVYTTPGVVNEVRDFRSKALLDASIASGKVKISSPAKVSLERVIASAKANGSITKLSKNDMEVLALALELNAKIVTDDFTLQNLASHLRLEYEGVARGIIKTRKKFKK